MAAILLDNIVIDLSSSSDYSNWHNHWHNDTATLETFSGDDHDLKINVGDDSLSIRAPLGVMMMIMDAIALEVGYKTVAVVGDKNQADAECCDEYFDRAGVYHLNKRDQ